MMLENSSAANHRAPLDARARAALFGVAGCALSIAVLHGLQPELSVLHGPVSFYVHGSDGWLLPVGLVSCGIAAVALGRAACEGVGRDTRINLSILGVGMVFAAVFRSDRWFVWEQIPTLRGVVHAVATVVALGALGLTALRFVRNPPPRFRQRPTRRVFVGLGVLYSAGLLVSVASLLAGLARDGPPPFIGLGERMLGATGLAWLVVFAMGLRGKVAPAVGR